MLENRLKKLFSKLYIFALSHHKNTSQNKSAHTYTRTHVHTYTLTHVHTYTNTHTNRQAHIRSFRDILRCFRRCTTRSSAASSPSPATHLSHSSIFLSLIHPSLTHPPFSHSSILFSFIHPSLIHPFFFIHPSLSYSSILFSPATNISLSFIHTTSTHQAINNTTNNTTTPPLPPPQHHKRVTSWKEAGWKTKCLLRLFRSCR